MVPKFCSQCGAALTAGAKFCEQCGTAIAGMTAAAPPAPAVALPQPVTPPPPAPTPIPIPIPAPAPSPWAAGPAPQAAPWVSSPQATPWASSPRAGPAPIVEGAPYAGIVQRFGALLVDGFLLGGLWWLAGGLIMRQLYTWFWRMGLSPTTGMYAIGILAGWLYFAGLESSARQGTIGKMICKIRVVDLQGRRIGFGKATGRYLAKILSALPLGLGFLAAAFSQTKQAWHDKLSGCLVIRNT